MKAVTPSTHGADSRANNELAQLYHRAKDARTELARVLQSANAAEYRLAAMGEAGWVDSADAVQLVEVNQQLLLSSLKALSDADECRSALQEASQSSVLDSLTQLPNQVVLLDRLKQAIAAAKRHGGCLAVLSLDISPFTQIDTTLGDGEADQVLQRVAHSLSHLVRDCDTVSRNGREAFVFLLTGLAQSADAVVVARKVMETLDRPSRVGDHVLRLSACLGISIYPDDGGDPQALIDKAESAMARARQREPRAIGFHGKPLESGRSLHAARLSSLKRPLTLYEQAVSLNDTQQAQLRQANGQLVIAALTAQELQAAAEKARAKQTAFLGVLAHELRHPLAPIRNAAAVLGKIPTHEPMLAQLQAVIDRQVAHMSRLVSDLLDASRVDTGKLRLERQTVDMTTIIDQSVEACRPAMDMREQSFKVQMPQQTAYVDGDPVRLTQILNNLLDNASKYTPEGGSIELSVAVQGNALIIDVSDTGIGITAGALPHVFEPFVQDIQATSFNGFGLGLGLTVVRELVEAHGGIVVAHSGGSGRGSRFVVTLPLDVPATP